MQITNFSKDNGTAQSELYRLINSYLWIPVLISVVVLAGLMIFTSNGKERLKKFSNNLIVLALVTILMPSVFTALNTNIFGKDSKLLTVSSKNTSASIVFNHTTDFLYVYNKYVKNNLTGAVADFAQKKDIKKLTDKDKNTDAWTLSNKNHYSPYLGQTKNKKGVDMSKVDVIGFDFNQTIDEDTILEEEGDTLKVPDMFTRRMSLLTQQKINDLLEKQDGNAAVRGMLEGLGSSCTSKLRSGGFFVGDEHYYRYRTDYICVFLELIANIFLYVAASYAFVKLAWELMVNRIILAFIGASDLNGGERIKRILTSIIGLYVSFMFVGFTIQLFNSACLFISRSKADGGLGINGLAYSIIVVFLASVALDGPNIIARYFGVNTGMRGGAMMLAGGVMAAKRASDRVRHNMGSAYRDARREYSNSQRDRGTHNDGSHRPPLVVMQPPASTQTQPQAQLGSTSSGSTIPVEPREKPKTLDEYKNRIADENPLMSQEEQERAANQRMAEDNKDELMKSAIIGKAASEENGTPYTDRQALQGAVEEKANEGMFDKQYAPDVADSLYSNGQFKKANTEAYSSIAENANKLIDENKDKYSKPMDAYVSAAQGYGANGDTAVYMGNVAYADNYRKTIRAEAIQYKNEMRGNNKQITDAQALAHVIRNNTNGCARDINPQYAENIARSMLNNGNLYNGDIRDSYRRNKGAGQL